MITPEEKLGKLISDIHTMQNFLRDGNRFSIWHKAVTRTLKTIFGENDVHVKQFTDIHFSPVNKFYPNDTELQDAYLAGLTQSALYLGDIFEEIPDTNKVIEEQHVSDKSHTDVFIVHGHDNEAKQETARLIEQLKLKAIILHEQPNRGRTVVEKLQQESKTAGYAVILLTPDDLGTVKGNDELEARARQNVVLELGYFLGKLGREKMCILLKDSTTVPSNFNGIVYIPMDDAGRWKYDLAKELTGAGFSINLDNIT